MVEKWDRDAITRPHAEKSAGHVLLDAAEMVKDDWESGAPHPAVMVGTVIKRVYDEHNPGDAEEFYAKRGIKRGKRHYLTPDAARVGADRKKRVATKYHKPPTAVDIGFGDIHP